MLLAALALLLANVVTLDSTSKIVELTTSASGDVDCIVSYVDSTTTAYTPGSTPTTITTATTTTILAAPASSTQRAVTRVICSNNATTANTLTVKLDVSATEYHLTPAISLAAGHTLNIDDKGAVTVLAKNGAVLRQPSETTGYNGLPVSWMQKVGTLSEAVGVRYIHAKDTGTPSAWVPGAPGLNGDALACNTAADATIAGSPLLPDPSTGFNYLTYGALSSTVVHSFEIYDLIWYNSLVVATTTAQAVTMPALGARDATGTTNGEGWILGLYTTTTGTAAAITTGTASYTDSDGNAGATATMASWPATAVAGTFVPYQLAAGDRGVRSVQSITLAVAHTTEVLWAVVLRPIMRIPSVLANVGTSFVPPQNPGIRLYNGTCFWVGYMSGATTLTTSSVDLWVQER